MTPAEALDLLDRMAQHTPATRADHMAAAQAVEVLRPLTREEGGDGEDPLPST